MIINNVINLYGGEQLNNDIKKLLEQFLVISNKGWIPSVSKSFGSIGLTFEKELGKKADSMYFPDYYGIEIKCTSVLSKYPLYLFTVAFDGPTFPEINRIIECYGYSDKDYPEYKVLATKLNCKKMYTVNNNFKFLLELDKEEEKVFLCVYNLKNELIERKSFVYFDSIRNHLLLKLNYLALVLAKTKHESNTKYFKYINISIYKLSSFDNFMSLLESGVIDVSLIARISKSGNDIKRYRNKNLVFEINKNKIDKLFNRIYVSNKNNLS